MVHGNEKLKYIYPMLPDTSKGNVCVTSYMIFHFLCKILVLAISMVCLSFPCHMPYLGVRDIAEILL